MLFLKRKGGRVDLGEMGWGWGFWKERRKGKLWLKCNV